MREHISREAAWAALRRYNQEPFHLQHALTVEGVMQWYAKELGYGDDAEFWGIVGLLHDIDFERWPEEHCQKAPELLREAGCGEDIIHAVCSHGCGLCCDVAPEHEMEKGSGVDAAQPQLSGYGAEEPEKEVQGQEVRRRVLP